ncbi:MAG: ABC transporter permease [Bacillota bacterium]|nr:ABC transporter permease [Bacillota bacterium]
MSNKVFFVFKMAISNIIRFKFINLMIVASFSLGLFFIAFVLSIGNAALSDLKDTYFIDYEKVVVLRPSSGILNKHLDLEDLNKLKKSNEDIEFIVRSVEKDGLINTNGHYKLDGTILYVDKNYEKLFNNVIDIGAWFNGNKSLPDKKECIIGSTFLNDFKGNAIGKTVSVDGMDIRIIGTTNKKDLRDKIILPIDSYNNVIAVNSVPEYIIKFKENIPNYNSISKLINYIKKGYGGYDFSLGKETFKNIKEQVSRNIVLVLLIVAVVLIYSLFNIYNMLNFRLNDSKDLIATLMALGATSTDLLLHNCIELSCLMIISSLIVYILIYISNLFTMFIGIDLKIDLYILSFLILISLVSSIILNIILIRKYTKQYVMEIYR